MAALIPKAEYTPHFLCDLCRTRRRWSVKDRNVKRTRLFCEEHVPPVDTPRMTRYQYFGALRQRKHNDPQRGDTIKTSVGGKSVYGTHEGSSQDYGCVRIKWHCGKVEKNFPCHLVSKITPLEALALVMCD